MSGRQTFELILTGFWLGTAQVGLGFHLMRSQGAGAGYYFAMLAIWLLGSLAGLAFLRRVRTGMAFQVLSAGAIFLACWSTRQIPFSGWSLASALVALLMCGAYAGWFLERRIAAGGDVARVLFQENNGFVLGYICAGALLFFSIPAIDRLTMVTMGITMWLEATRPEDPGRCILENPGGDRG